MIVETDKIIYSTFEKAKEILIPDDYQMLKLATLLFIIETILIELKKKDEPQYLNVLKSYSIIKSNSLFIMEFKKMKEEL